MELSNKKISHMHAVAEYMYKKAKERHLSPESMYFLGLNHDIGHLFGEKDHGENAWGMFGRLGLNHELSEAIRFHEIPPEEVIIKTGSISPELALLYEADMMIGADGTELGYEKHLKEIKEKYGKESPQYNNAKKIVRWLSV